MLFNAVSTQTRYPQRLHLDRPTFRKLLELQGPSLGLWRAAEIAVLRQQIYEPPVLDLGCGDGLVTSFALPQVEFGVDPNLNAITKAESLGIYRKLFALPIEQVNLSDRSLNTILSNSVLEHIPNLDSVLATVARLLQPGGKLIFTVPTEAFSEWLALPFAPYSDWRNQSLNHLNLWTVERWTETLKRAGLQVETIQPYLNREWVSAWDGLELLQQIWLGEQRLFSLFWRNLPEDWLDTLAEWATTLDLSALPPGGGRLIVARKVEGY